MAEYSHNTNDITPVMTANNAPGPYSVSASSEYNADYAAWKAFNHSIADYNQDWASDGSALPAWIGIYFGNGKIVKSCTISAAYGGWYPYAPTEFTIQAANQSNYSDAVTLSTQSGLSWSTNEMKTFSWSNTTAYYYFRLYITAIATGSICHVGEIEIFDQSINSINSLQKIPHNTQLSRSNPVELLNISTRQRIGTVGTNKHNYIGV
jgi:hypothetical protein